MIWTELYMKFTKLFGILIGRGYTECFLERHFSHMKAELCEHLNSFVYHAFTVMSCSFTPIYLTLLHSFWLLMC